MTLVVGFNMGKYALIASDTRVCYYLPNGEVDYSDDREKLQATSMGLISGAGLVNLLEPVKDRLEAEEIVHTEQIRDVIRAERRIAEARWPNADQRLRDGIAHTAWMLTYVNGDGAQSIHDVKLRLAVTLPHEDYALGLTGPDSGTMIPPLGLTPAEEAELQEMCNDGLVPWNGEPGEMMDNVMQHAVLIARVMQRASELSEMVAPSFQLGLHHVYGLVSSTTILSPPDYQFDWRWHRGGPKEEGA